MVKFVRTSLPLVQMGDTRGGGETAGSFFSDSENEHKLIKDDQDFCQFQCSGLYCSTPVGQNSKCFSS